ncbi:hypothetical protein QA601_00935 [Chitinispirillales bacterium ANBcel5]|uniref:hypothetical protein n=1 Tax=Cellulosispirillum alkaliphilum TaxID=3039283 RepID=UPI002A5041C4|nr:hypothetical protein [Chitinispirillales bacterium ANBcel5]
MSTKYKSRISLTFIKNEYYYCTNNIYSFYLAREYLVNGFYLFESDVFFEHSLLKKMVNSPYDNLIVSDNYRPQLNGTVVLANSAGRVKKMLLPQQQTPAKISDSFKTVNFYKFDYTYTNKCLLPGLEREISLKNTGVYYEHIIMKDINEGCFFTNLTTSPFRWFEIDTQEDLRAAEKLFSSAGDGDVLSISDDTVIAQTQAS